jgi:dihydroneopterin aldolase
MTRTTTIELKDLHIATKIGTYGPSDVVPEAHILDLKLTIAPDLVQINADEMARVFDYDPLIKQIDQIARDKHYETQEYIISLIAKACAGYEQILELDIALRKQPVLAGTGSLGVRLTLGAEEMQALRVGRSRARA